MSVDGKFLAVNGKSNLDGTCTAVTQHDGKFLAVDDNSNFDGKSPLYRDRPPVRYFYAENLPNTSLLFSCFFVSPRRAESPEIFFSANDPVSW